MIDKIDFLTERECLEVRSVIYELKKLWQPRDIEKTWFTLGSATYLDAVKYGASVYCAKAKLFNNILCQHFDWLYEKLSDTLAIKLGKPTCYQQKYALPGFHIFYMPKGKLHHNPLFLDFEQQRFLAHVDEQHKLLNWEFLGCKDFCETISFTLTITLPKFGSGLDVWNLHSKEIFGLSRQEVIALLCSKSKTFYPYEVGKIAIHSGLFFHQISLPQKPHPNDERITLQGHGVYYQGIWHLYW